MKTSFEAIGALLLAVLALGAIGFSWLTLRKPAQRPAPLRILRRTSAAR